MSNLEILLLVFIIIVSLLLVFVIMAQNPKGGGLSGAFGGAGGSSAGGFQQTNSFLDKSTWTLGLILAALVFTSNIISYKSKGSSGEGSKTLQGAQENVIESAPVIEETNDAIKIEETPAPTEEKEETPEGN